MPIHFMLAPDAQSGATIREQFAQLDAINVKVGTFDVLLDLLLEYWLLQVTDESEWRMKLSHTALGMSDAFWAESIKTDEKSVVDELDTSLQVLLNALPLDVDELSVLEANTARYSRYYNDLVALHNGMGNILPSTLGKARLWNKSSELKSLEEIVVYADVTLQLEAWQWEVVKKLQSQSLDVLFQTLYAQTFALKFNSEYDDIIYLQSMLFTDQLPNNPSKKNRLQWLVARDVQQEVEIVAGMVQTAVKSGASFDDIAIVIPRDGWYKDFLIQTFKTFHIPLSRAGQVEEYADLGTQWIFDALQAQDEFAAPMLFASLFSSPLMPYSLAKGQYLASVALDNAWRDKEDDIKANILEKFSEETQSLILTIINWQEQTNTQPLNDFFEQLEELYPMLNSHESIRLHKKRFKTLLEELNEYLAAFVNAEAKDLLNQIRPYALQESLEREAFLHSIHVVYETDYMIQEVKHLFVLGFNDGHYPKKLENVGVFSRMNWESLSKDLKLPLAPQEQFYTNAKETFKRQMQCAKETITFMSSALDLQGSRLTPSSSLSDMAFCFHDGKRELEPNELLILLEEEKEVPFFYVTNDTLKTKARKELSSTDLNFAQNIFELRKNEDGTLRPESPSSLEKLMISPLGWFFYRQGLEPKTWGIQELDVATQGTIAHGVFEDCFCPKNPTHDLSDIKDIIQKRIHEYAPFLSQDHRRLEHEQLRTSILKSAEEFKALLIHCDASVLSTERQLTGEIFGISVAGRTDAILNILGKNLVLDYKKSGSKGRISRMKEGYDHQLLLYRVMLDDENALTAYYTMNDATLVVDQEIDCDENWDFNIVGIEVDCTVNASALLKERIEELINGDIKLNSEGDSKLWEERGVTASYSLESSPLIKLFMKSEEEEI